MCRWLVPFLVVLSVGSAAAGTALEWEEAVTAQVMLDRAHFSPGEVDGVWGDNAQKALRAFQEANSFEPVGPLTPETSAALRRISGTTEPITRYQLTQADLDGPYLTTLPREMAKLPSLPHLGYTSVSEMLGERFHADPRLLERLNPKARWEAGEEVRVPAVNPTIISMDPDLQAAIRDGKTTQTTTGDLLDSGIPAEAKNPGGLTITVSKSQGTLRVTDEEGKMVFFAPVTTGSEHDPLPLGEWKVKGTERYPEYSYNPKLFWDAKPGDTKARIKAGPNGPVGAAWIDLDRPHYGIHGTAEPGKIGYSESHGCVRLTNWDALRLADLVKPGTRVLFKE